MEYLSTFSNVVMAIVWVAYFQFFFWQYRRSRRPYLVIHHAQNEDPEALCLLVNMSESPVHIQCVQVVVTDQQGEISVLGVTQYERVDGDDHNVQRSLRQGPLRSGDFLVLGAFADIVRGRNSTGQILQKFDDIRALEIRAAAIHGPSPFPVGVRRTFTVQHEEDGASITPCNVHTEQLTRRKDRAQVRRWLEEELQPQRKGKAQSDRSDQRPRALKASS